MEFFKNVLPEDEPVQDGGGAQEEELAKMNHKANTMNEYGMIILKNEMRSQQEDMRKDEVVVQQDFRYSAGH